MNQKMADQFNAVAKQNQALADRLKSVADENQTLSAKVDDLSKRLASPSPSASMNGGGGTDDDDDDDQPPDVRTDEPTSRRRTGATPATSGDGDGDGGEEDGDEDQPPDIRTDEPQRRPREKPTRTFFDEGFKFETHDGEFTLHFHNETQLDLRAYEQRASDPVNQTGFYIPRMRLYFNGRLTKPIEYSVSVNKGLGDLDLLDAYLNFNYNPKFQIRFGRFRVPYTYDWYALSNQFLTTPERSIFALNYGYNRNFAVMGHGELFDERLDYAVAAVNGPRNSFFDSNGHKDVLAYVNYRPFYQSERLPFLKHLNVGGSAAYGIQDQVPRPISFHTSSSASESPGTFEASPSFLELNKDVRERGARELWELHMAYYYKGLSLWGAWDAGYNDYGRTNAPGLVHLPTQGYHVAAGYFLTGEQVERRTFVTPLRPFDLRKGKVGPGAIELQARYSEFSVGDQVFTGGLADPNLWANQVYAIDSGFNWYLNKYVKLYFDWQHSVFNNPVPYRPGGFQKTSDLFWLRCQIYF